MARVGKTPYEMRCLGHNFPSYAPHSNNFVAVLQLDLPKPALRGMSELPLSLAPSVSLATVPHWSYYQDTSPSAMSFIRVCLNPWKQAISIYFIPSSPCNSLVSSFLSLPLSPAFTRFLHHMTRHDGEWQNFLEVLPPTLSSPFPASIYFGQSKSDLLTRAQRGDTTGESDGFRSRDTVNIYGIHR